MSAPSEPVLPDLAAYQRTLLETLFAGSEPSEVRQKLKSIDLGSAFDLYVDTMEDRMLLVARELVQKWAERRDRSTSNSK